MIPERLILTVTSGRSGTKHLSRILGLLPGVAALHEPEPNFVPEMLSAQEDPRVATEFLYKKKIPALAAIPQKYYAEISSLWCKGLLQAWLAEPSLPVPDLILLDRDLRRIALSIFRLELTPERTHNGREWYLGPSAKTALLKVGDFQKWSDYQLCYCYALEVEARKLVLGKLAAVRGGRVVRVGIEKLRSLRNLYSLVRALDLPRPGPREIYSLLWLLRKKTNSQGSEKWTCPYEQSQVADWEAAVIQEVIANGNRLPQQG
ncbi:MAG: hypothetical protein JHC85_12050 [Chthoniobacterales bacterium]|nr:hypothetical protein [Chthoniobacterales bacterium]